jgi:hypothetical protein
LRAVAAAWSTEALTHVHIQNIRFRLQNFFDINDGDNDLVLISYCQLFIAFYFDLGREAGYGQSNPFVKAIDGGGPGSRMIPRQRRVSPISLRPLRLADGISITSAKGWPGNAGHPFANSMFARAGSDRNLP